MTPIKSALISVFYKDKLESVIRKLYELGVELYSTGGTEKFIKKLNIPVNRVEELTEYPSILGGRVKTLHPRVFGGILSRRNFETDSEELATYSIPPIDLVIVDLYPFETTLAGGATEEEIIEKIDIGGISLIRAAAKNYNDVLVIPGMDYYNVLLDTLESNNGNTTRAFRKQMAAAAFEISSRYDSAIYGYFSTDLEIPALKVSEANATPLRYGENPHQEGRYYGDIDEIFNQLHGKALSYNNLLDIDAAIQLMDEFRTDNPTFIILKHNNACGLATRKTLADAFSAALAGDPVSAFGGILIANKTIDRATAELINTLFCEVVIAPGYTPDALEIVKSKKNRIILVQKPYKKLSVLLRTALNGMLWQEKDTVTDRIEDFEYVTTAKPEPHELADLEFASKIAKHTKSNTIVLAKNGQLLASGTGQTSRVDALNQAVAKAQNFGFDLTGSVMASDAFFPFPDCVEIAKKAGVKAVIQPGGSIKDKLSIDYCNENGLAMVFTGKRHFKH